MLSPKMKEMNMFEGIAQGDFNHVVSDGASIVLYVIAMERVLANA